MLINTDGIILRNTRCDKACLITTYTRTAGKLTFSFRNKPGKSGAGALLIPMTIVTIVADIKPGREIHYTRELSLSYGYKSFPGDPLKSAVLIFFNELLLKTLKEEEPDPALFEFVMKMLVTLDEQKPLHPSYHLSAMINLARYVGFFPQNRNYSKDICFDLREGKFHNAHILHHDVLSPELSKVMNELISIPFDEYQQLRLDRNLRNELLDALISFYRLHIAGFGQMKSVSVLRALFD